jgi:hypothetical protein
MSPVPRFAKTDTALLGFCASIARVMTVSQVPVSIRPHHLRGFFYYPPGSYITHGPTRRGGSASEVRPSEVFPFADQSPVSGFRPSCRWNRVAPRLQGALRRRSVGAGTPRSSPGVRTSRASSLAARRAPSRDAVPSCASPASSPKGRDRRRSRVCSATRSACLSRGSVPSWSSWPCSLLRLLGRHSVRDHGFSSTVPPPRGRLPVS